MTDGDAQPDLLTIARRMLPRFAIPRAHALTDVGDAGLSIKALTGGHINDSFLVAAGDQGEATAPPLRFVLQRINHQIFADPPALMSNIVRVTEHIRRRLTAIGADDIERRVLTVVPASDERPFVEDEDSGTFWRLYRHIDGARAEETVRTPEDAEQVGRAYGEFQRQLAVDFPWPPLIEPIRDFHDTPLRMDRLDVAAARDERGLAREAQADISAILRYPRYADYIVEQRRRHVLPDRVVHNDCKRSNVLLDERTGRRLCVVDLDTVMTGTVLYDFGDMVRTIISTVAEDEPNAGLVDLRLDLFEGLARGYLAETRRFLTEGERRGLVMSGLVITLEQAARFMTDYLSGDTYYKTTRPRQNLDRARTQITLFLRLLAARQEMERIVDSIP